VRLGLRGAALSAPCSGLRLAPAAPCGILPLNLNGAPPSSGLRHAAPYRSTSMAQSGQIVAQNAQPMHLPMSSGLTVAGWKPFELSVSASMATMPLGHAVVQSLQPLHRSMKNFTPAISPYL
jgi:hypothetical protein